METYSISDHLLCFAVIPHFTVVVQANQKSPDYIYESLSNTDPKAPQTSKAKLSTKSADDIESELKYEV